MKQTAETTDLSSQASHKNTKTREHITESCPTVFTLATRLEQWIIFKLLLFTYKVVTSSLTISIQSALTNYLDRPQSKRPSQSLSTYGSCGINYQISCVI